MLPVTAGRETAPVKSALVARSISKSVSFGELSVQLRLIWVPDAAVAVSPVGAVSCWVVALTSAVRADCPFELRA